MARYKKTRAAISRGQADTNIFSSDLCSLMQALWFSERIREDPHIFLRAGVDEILNFQPKAGKAKVYQVKQVRAVILKYKLGS